MTDTTQAPVGPAKLRRGRPGSRMTASVTVSLPDDLHGRIQTASRRYSLAKGVIARGAIRRGLTAELDSLRRAVRRARQGR